MTSIGRTENEVSLWCDIKSHKNALVGFTDPLNAAGERVDDVASAITELDVTVAKAMKIKQDEPAELVNVTTIDAAISKLPGLTINRPKVPCACISQRQR